MTFEAIPTTYRDIQLRSRLEADTAYLLDGLGCRWFYEPLSYKLPNGADYRPDFWVPVLRVWVECRGYETDYGERQLEGFATWILQGGPCPDAAADPPFGEISAARLAPVLAQPAYLLFEEPFVTIYEYGETIDDELGRGAVGAQVFLSQCAYCRRWGFGPGGVALHCRLCFSITPSWGIRYKDQADDWFPMPGGIE